MDIKLHQNRGQVICGPVDIEFSYTPATPAYIASDPRFDDPPEPASVRIESFDIAGDDHLETFVYLGVVEFMEEQILKEITGQS